MPRTLRLVSHGQGNRTVIRRSRTNRVLGVQEVFPIVVYHASDISEIIRMGLPGYFFQGPRGLEAVASPTDQLRFGSSFAIPEYHM